MIETTIDVARQLVVTRAIGSLTEDDLASVRAHLKSDATFSPAFRHLLDLRYASHITLTGAWMTASSLKPLFDPTVRRAFVADTDFQFGMARMFALYAQSHGHPVQVFRCVEDATAWLADGADPMLSSDLD